MRIGTFDIASVGAKQWNVTFGYSSISNQSKWDTNAVSPMLVNSTYGFKPLKVVILVKGRSREEIVTKVSKIISNCMEYSEIELDGYEHHFIGVLKKHSVSEKSKDRWHDLTLEFDCYEVGEWVEVSQARCESLTINNSGNIRCPAEVRIKPTASVASLNVDGFGKRITIQNLVRNAEVVIDGISGLVNEDGETKIRDVLMFNLPYLEKGINRINLSNDWMDVTVRYRPRYI